MIEETKAEDTVMSHDNLNKYCKDKVGHQTFVPNDRDRREAQAEISFKIGKTAGVAESLIPALKAIEASRKAGRMEVVEVIGDRIKHTKSAHKFNETSLCFACRYEAQLNKWRILK